MNEEQKGQNKMKQYQIIIIIVAVLIVLGAAAFFIFNGMGNEEPETLQTIDTAAAGDEVTEAVAATTFQIGLDDVVATVNGEPITGADMLTSYQDIINYYGEPDAESEELYYSVAMEQSITLKLIQMTAAELGVDELTQEEIDDLNATSDSEWQYALDNYVSTNIGDLEGATDEEKASAYAEAEDYYAMMGYTKDVLRKSYLENEIYERVTNELSKDVAVSDEEVQAYYDETVAADRETYEFDVDAYETQMMMYQYGYAEQEPWYHPEGYRYIKHILLAVDEDLMTTYTDLLARYEEQMDDEEAAAAEPTDADTADADTAETVVVTAEDIDAAKAAIIASVQTEIDEINQKLAEGVSFEDLIAEYGTDPGMADGSYPNGYEVSLASYGYVTDFVSAAFSVDNIGDISDPVISEYGVHIVKYVADVPGGPLELTDDLKALIEETLMEDKRNAVLDDWYNSADIQYTGIVRSVQEIQAEEAETAADTTDVVEPTDTTETDAN